MVRLYNIIDFFCRRDHLQVSEYIYYIYTYILYIHMRWKSYHFNLISFKAVIGYQPDKIA